VSIQFSLHYSFESEERATRMLENVTCRLLPGGYFIGSIPDANYLVKKVRSVEGLTFGNSVYRVQFDQKDSFPVFGSKYQFFLEDAVNAPEYLVHFPSLVKLAGEYGLELCFKARFHDFYEQNIENPSNRELWHKMTRLNEEGSIPSDEWEAIGLYLAFAFRKRGEPTTRKFNYGNAKITSAEDIIVVHPSQNDLKSSS